MFREPIEQVLVNGFINAGDTRAALMIKSAKDQRNIQWAAEENMWISTAKAMATFFEGFVVSLVCLIPFVMFMGGLNIMIEYLKVLMWVQLWNPVMAICNLYIQTVASQKVKDAIANSPITDLYVIDSVEEVAQHWIAVGGLMAATTPLLALFILKGSVYTFTTLASRMSGGDHVNEKMVSPDVMQHAPMLNNSAGAWNADTAKGVRGVGTDANFATISGEQMAQAMESSSRSDVEKKSRGYARSVKDVMGVLKRGGKMQEAGESFCKTLQSQNVQAYNWLMQHTIENLKSNGWTTTDNITWTKDGMQTTTSTSAMTYGLTVSGGVGVTAGSQDKGANAHGGAEVSSSSTHTNANASSESEKNSNSHQAAVNDGATSADKESGGYGLTGGEAYAENFAEAANAAVKDVFENTANQSLSDDMTNSYNAMRDSQRSHTQTDQRAKNIKAVKSMDSGQWARQYMDDAKYEEFMKKLSPYDRNTINNELQKDGYLTGKTGTENDKNKAALLEWAVMSGRNDDLTDKFWDHFGFGSLNPNQVNEKKNNDIKPVTSGEKDSLGGDNIRKRAGGMLGGAEDTTGQKLQQYKKDVRDHNTAARDKMEAAKRAKEQKEMEAMQREVHRRDMRAKVFMNESGKSNEDLMLFEKRQVGRLPIDQKTNYLNYAKNLVSGNGVMNGKAAAFGLQYMEDNVHAWCSDRNDSTFNNPSKNRAFEKNDVWFDRMMREKPKEFNAAIDEIGRNMGLSREQAEDVMRALPTMMRGTYIEYDKLSSAFQKYKEQGAVVKQNSSMIEAVLKGKDTNGDLQQRAYAIFGNYNEKLEDFYSGNVREFFHDRGYSFVNPKPGVNRDNYLDEYRDKNSK